MLKAIAHIVLALSILISSMGFTVFERLCNISGRDVALSANHEACCEGHEHRAEAHAKKVKGSCCKLPVKEAPVAVKATKCCEFNAIFLQAHAGAPTVDWKAPVLDANVFFVHPVALLDELVLDQSGLSPVFSSFLSDPPDGRDIRILHQSFRC